MLYRFFYYIVNVALRVYYRKIYINGLANIKKDQAYLIASNHPAGFMEPLIMACLFPRDLYFLVRGDLFEKPVLKHILIGTHQLPIFRFKDGFSSLRQNQETINKVVETLAEKKAVLIFGEGSTEYKFTVRPMQKGLARIGFQTLGQFPDLDIKVIPVGTSFNQVDKISGDVIINIGEAFDVSDFYTADPQLQVGAINALTKRTQEEIEKLVLHESEDLTKEDIRAAWTKTSLSQNEGFFPRVVKNSTFFDLLNVNLQPFSKKEEPSTNYVNGKKYNWYLLLIPFAIPAFLLTALPRYVAIKLRNKLVKKIEFKSPIAFAAGTFLSLILWFIVNVDLLINYGLGITLLTDVILFLSGLAYMFTWENTKKP